MSHTQMTLERKKVFFFFFALCSFVMRHVTCTYEHVMSHIQISLLFTFFSKLSVLVMRHVACACKHSMSHIQMSRDTQTDASCHAYESCHTYIPDQ